MSSTNGCESTRDISSDIDLVESLPPADHPGALVSAMSSPSPLREWLRAASATVRDGCRV